MTDVIMSADCQQFYEMTFVYYMLLTFDVIFRRLKNTSPTNLMNYDLFFAIPLLFSTYARNRSC